MNAFHLTMSNPAKRQKQCWLGVYLASVVVFLLLVVNFYLPGYGFTALEEFGDFFDTKSIAGLHCFVEPKSHGYDGQFYARLALDPVLAHPAADEQGVDDLYYRGRRILMSWAAWALGLGQPVWILQAFAVINVACWLGLAWLLARWFPPLDFDNFVRWAGILFSFGIMQSVRSSLTDGPALFFVALGLLFYERKQETWAAGMLAIAGLTRETSLLAFTALADPAKRTRREIGRVALLGVLAVAPLFCWMVYLKLHLGHPAGGGAGVNNFSPPFAAWLRKWGSIFSELGQGRWAWEMLLVQLALTVQAVYLLARPAISKPAWRMGVVFAVMMFCLGDAVWEGFPGATGRTVLPMLLAFNLLVPRGRWWLPLLVAGNLSVAVQPMANSGVPGDVTIVNVAQPSINADGRELAFRFGREWFRSERAFLGTRYRWSPGATSVTIINPHAFAVEANLAMELCSKRGESRALSLVLNGREIWSGALNTDPITARATSLRLEPGDNTLEFKTAEAAPPPNGKGIPRAFRLRSLTVDVLSAADH